MKLPEILSHYPYSSDNYGANSLSICFGSLQLFFSYKTIIAFRDNVNEWGRGDLIVSENCWSNTTGKHLNNLDGGNKKDRLKRDQFELKLSEVLKKHQLE